LGRVMGSSSFFRGRMGMAGGCVGACRSQLGSQGPLVTDGGSYLIASTALVRAFPVSSSSARPHPPHPSFFSLSNTWWGPVVRHKWEQTQARPHGVHFPHSLSSPPNCKDGLDYPLERSFLLFSAKSSAKSKCMSISTSRWSQPWNGIFIAKC
jgi:hypothetical protein